MYLHTLSAFVLGTKEGFAIPLSLRVRLWTSINLGHWGLWQGCARSNNIHSSLAPWDHHTSLSVLGTLIFHLPGVAVFLPSIRQLLIPCLVLRRCILLPWSLLYIAFFISQFPLFILIIINDFFGSYLNYISFTTWPEVSSFRVLVIVLSFPPPSPFSTWPPTILPSANSSTEKDCVEELVHRAQGYHLNKSAWLPGSQMHLQLYAIFGCSNMVLYLCCFYPSVIIR